MNLTTKFNLNENYKILFNLIIMIKKNIYKNAYFFNFYFIKIISFLFLHFNHVIIL